MDLLCGGVIRDWMGRWIVGFARNIGYYSAYLAELGGAVEGLVIAWKEGFKKIVLEADSQTLIQNLKNQDCKDGVATSLLLRCKE